MTEGVRILLVEDEESLLDAIKLNLEMEGYKVVTATSGTAAIEQFKKSRFDLILLDVMLPEMDGFSVCRTIRLENDKVPILFLTAKDSSTDKVQGLKLGGDDYLTKPFNLEEFLLRVQNLLKRAATVEGKQQLHVYKLGKSEVSFTNYEIKDKNGQKHALSQKEMLLLKLLIERKNEVISRKEILETVWGYDVYPSTRTIDNYILAFRKYFEPNPKNPQFFHSVRGVGYKFTA
ncbi:MAG: DNA-binding response regulator [Flavobacteriales bacterium]|nr:MAG: DNA-binding response regulator [Flavobacteriales bacterium]